MTFEELYEEVVARHRIDYWSDEYRYWYPEHLEAAMKEHYRGYEDQLKPYIGVIPISDRDPDDPYWQLGKVVQNAAYEAGGFQRGNLFLGISAAWLDPAWERLWQAAWALEHYEQSQRERDKFQRWLEGGSWMVSDDYTYEEKLVNWKRRRAPREPES